MASAYNRLHRAGHAHSVEVWQHNKLVGGLYGIGIGKIFFGESMFSRIRDASKIALTALVKYLEQHQFAFIDCQVESPHLNTLGARAIARPQFIKYLDIYCNRDVLGNVWSEFISKDELLALL
jgi:leucyl/phenylalanyl-tRNA--protein transferase